MSAHDVSKYVIISIAGSASDSAKPYILLPQSFAVSSSGKPTQAALSLYCNLRLCPTDLFRSPVRSRLTCNTDRPFSLYVQSFPPLGYRLPVFSYFEASSLVHYTPLAAAVEFVCRCLFSVPYIFEHCTFPFPLIADCNCHHACGTIRWFNLGGERRPGPCRGTIRWSQHRWFRFWL